MQAEKTPDVVEVDGALHKSSPTLVGLILYSMLTLYSNPIELHRQ